MTTPSHRVYDHGNRLRSQPGAHRMNTVLNPAERQRLRGAAFVRSWSAAILTAVLNVRLCNLHASQVGRWSREPVWTTKQPV